jgi:hypothetical protein
MTKKNCLYYINRRKNIHVISQLCLLYKHIDNYRRYNTLKIILLANSIEVYIPNLRLEK